jgi:hypothetical protein
MTTEKTQGSAIKTKINRNRAETERKSATKTSEAGDGAIIYFGFYWFILVFFGLSAVTRNAPQSAETALTGDHLSGTIKHKKKNGQRALCLQDT